MDQSTEADAAEEETEELVEKERSAAEDRDSEPAKNVKCFSMGMKGEAVLVSVPGEVF